MENLELYNRYAQPPENALRDFNNGKFRGTDINPMWRIRCLTESFGPCGCGWYTEVVRMWREDTPDNMATVYCHIRLYVKVGGEWSRPIEGVGGNTLTRVSKNGTSTTDEAYKMAYTDALGIACKALGIGANIWWQSNDSKYTAYQPDPAGEAAPQDKPQHKPFTPPAAAPVTVQKAATVPHTTEANVDRGAELDRLTTTYQTTRDNIIATIKAAAAAGELEGVNGSIVTMSDADFMRTMAVVEKRFVNAAGGAA